MPSRTSATILQADKDALAALEAMPGYDPRHERYRVTTAQAALAVMTEKQTISARADARTEHGRKAGYGTTKIEVDLHKVLLFDSGGVLSNLHSRWLMLLRFKLAVFRSSADGWGFAKRARSIVPLHRRDHTRCSAGEPSAKRDDN